MSDVWICELSGYTVIWMWLCRAHALARRAMPVWTKVTPKKRIDAPCDDCERETRVPAPDDAAWRRAKRAAAWEPERLVRFVENKVVVARTAAEVWRLGGTQGAGDGLTQMALAKRDGSRREILPQGRTPPGTTESPGSRTNARRSRARPVGVP